MRWRWARAVQSHPQVPGVPKGKEPLLPRAARPETARIPRTAAALTYGAGGRGSNPETDREPTRRGRHTGWLTPCNGGTAGKGGPLERGGGAPGPELTPELSGCRIVSLMGKAGRRGPGGRRKSHPSRATGHESGCECCPQGHPAQLPALPHPCIPCSLAHRTHWG